MYSDLEFMQGSKRDAFNLEDHGKEMPAWPKGRPEAPPKKDARARSKSGSRGSTRGKATELKVPPLPEVGDNIRISGEHAELSDRQDQLSASSGDHERLEAEAAYVRELTESAGVDPDCLEGYDPDLPPDDQALAIRKCYPFASALDLRKPTETRVRATMRTGAEMVSAVTSQTALQSDKVAGRSHKHPERKTRKAEPEVRGLQEYQDQFHKPQQYPYRQDRDRRRRTKLTFKDEPEVDQLFAQDDGWLRRQSMESLARLNPALAAQQKRQDAASRQQVEKRRDFARWKEQREQPALEDDKRRSMQRWVLPDL